MRILDDPDGPVAVTREFVRPLTAAEARMLDPEVEELKRLRIEQAETEHRLSAQQQRVHRIVSGLGGEGLQVSVAHRCIFRVEPIVEGVRVKDGSKVRITAERDDGH